MATYVTTEAITPIQSEIDFFKMMERRDPMGKYGDAVVRGLKDTMDELESLIEKKYHENLSKYGLSGSDMSSNYTVRMTDDYTIEIKVGTDYAIYVEYGTGIVGKQNKPHPNPEIPWQHDVNNHGEKGWFYMEGGRGHWTAGQASRPFMYDTWMWVRRSFTNIANKHISKRIREWERSMQ